MEIFDIDIHDPRVAFCEAKPGGWAGYVRVKDLYEALMEEDIPVQLHPNVPSDNRCLERGMQDLRSSRNLVRPLPKGRGWALVIEDADALDLEALHDDNGVRNAHKVEITAKVERAEDDDHLSSLRITPEDHPAVPMIRETFAYHRGTSDEDPGMFKCSQDLSFWFSQVIIPWVGGVANKNRGGAYYVLKGEGLKRLEKISRALERVSTYSTRDIVLHNGMKVTRTKVVQGGRVIIKPEFSTATAVEILIDNVINECDKACDDMDARLQSGTKGVRALGTQIKRTEAVMEKLATFEKFLGVSLEDTRDRLKEVQAATGMAKLRLEAEKDLERAS